MSARRRLGQDLSDAWRHLSWVLTHPSFESLVSIPARLPLLFFVRHSEMKLGVLAQHRPRPLRRVRFPAPAAAGRLPSLAIVTPSYNSAPFIEATMRSVLEQATCGVAYGVVDGGSTDGTAELVGRHASRLACAVSEPDAGQADAIAKGFRRVDGEIMAYLNADDILLPGALAFVRSYFARHPEVDAIYGHRLVIDAEGREIGRWVLPPHYSWMLRYVDLVPQETLFWRRRVYDAVGGIDPAYHFAMDWDFLLRMDAAGARLVRVPYFLACFRHHPGQKTVRDMDSLGAGECARLRARTGAVMDWPPFPLERVYYRAWISDVLLRFGVRV